MISGFDALTRQLNEAGEAAAALDGELVALNFEPADARSVQRAINEIEHAVDAKFARYRYNPLVADMVRRTKAHYRHDPRNGPWYKHLVSATEILGARF